MKKLILLLTTGLLLGAGACSSGTPDFNLQPGDLLFRGAVSGNLSQAIDQVTQTDRNTHFSHVGLVETTGDSIRILHASPVGGTCRISLHDFLHPEGDSSVVVAYRLKNLQKNTIPGALTRAEMMLGKPYNFTYILSDTAYYCSDFIYRAFVPDSVFSLNPMTFRDPRTGAFYPAWIEYYRKLGLKIPEGLPGCNPNGLAASEKLERLGVVKE